MIPSLVENEPDFIVELLIAENFGKEYLVNEGRRAFEFYRGI